MFKHGSLSTHVLAITLLAAATACGGGSGEEPKSPEAKASAEVSAIDQLKAIPKDLDAELASITKPIDDVQSVIDDVTAMPKKFGITVKDAMGMAKATVDNGSVEVKASGDLSAEAKAEIEGVLKRLKGVIDGIKAAPGKVAAFAPKVVAAAAKVPVLASKVTAAATFVASNPFGSKEDKAKAQTDLADVKQVQVDVNKSVNDAQAKISALPGLATSALAKLTAAFTAGS